MVASKLISKFQSLFVYQGFYLPFYYLHLFWYGWLNCELLQNVSTDNVYLQFLFHISVPPLQFWPLAGALLFCLEIALMTSTKINKISYKMPSVNAKGCPHIEWQKLFDTNLKFVDVIKYYVQTKT